MPHLKVFGNSANDLVSAIVGDEYDESFEEDNGEYNYYSDDEIDNEECHCDFEPSLEEKAEEPKATNSSSLRNQLVALTVTGKRSLIERIERGRLASPGQECPICFDPLQLASYARIPDCGHAYCSECLYQHCQSQLGNRENLKHNILVARKISSTSLTPSSVTLEHLRYGIKCPDPSCHFLLLHQDLQSFFTSEKAVVPIQFANLVEQDRKNSTPGVKYCPICSETALPDKRESEVRSFEIQRRLAIAKKKQQHQHPYVQPRHSPSSAVSLTDVDLTAEFELLLPVAYRCTSDSCKQLFCEGCSSVHHPGKSCKETNHVYKRQLISLHADLDLPPQLRLLLSNPRFLDIALATWLVEATTSEKIKCCPKCSEPIEKNQGCDHMHCVKCRTDFSWNAAPVYRAKFSKAITANSFNFKRSFNRLQKYFDAINASKQPLRR